MKRECIYLALSALLTFNAVADSVNYQVRNSLEMWEPVSVTHNKNVLKVISKERRITDQTYSAMITGICVGVISRPDSLPGITEIRILNKFGRQGYVFEGGANECLEYSKLPSTKAKMFMLDRTHLHMNN